MRKRYQVADTTIIRENLKFELPALKISKQLLWELNTFYQDELVRSNPFEPGAANIAKELMNLIMSARPPITCRKCRALCCGRCDDDSQCIGEDGRSYCSPFCARKWGKKSQKLMF